MTRPCWFAGISALVLGAAFAAVGVNAADEPRGANSKDAARDNVFEKCAKECSDCQRKCDSCADHCAAMLSGGERMHRETLASCQDCADLCATASRIMARSGPYAVDICKACADVCKKCAEKCEQFSKDEIMRDCAQECRKCQQACEQMLTGAHQKAEKPSLPRK